MIRVRLDSETDFAGWRAAARVLRGRGVAPDEVAWGIGDGERVAEAPPGAFTVPRAFVELAGRVVRHREPGRFDLLYRLLWRLAAEPHLLERASDPDVARALALAGEAGPSGNRREEATIPRPASEHRTDPMVTRTEPARRIMRTAHKVARDGAYGMDVPTELDDVAAGVDACRRCDLWRRATQGVVGEGPAHAPLMLVGEQPGDQEDLAGRPFVGPAGQVLDRLLVEAGLPRSQAYLANAVKHFKHELRGKRRIHQTPTTGEVQACRWWLDAERRLVRPRVIVALGATAALAVFGKAMPIAANRGKAIPLPDHAQGVVTYHPSYLLRVPDEEAKARAYAAFVEDLRFAWGLAVQSSAMKS